MHSYSQPVQTHIPETTLEFATSRENVGEVSEMVRAEVILFCHPLEHINAVKDGCLEVV